MEFVQICDRVETDAAGRPDHSGLPGVWINSNPGTSGIARLVIFEADGNLSLQVYAIGQAGLIDWGLTDVAVFSASPDSQQSAGFTCVYDFGFAEARLQAMVLKGLIVLAQIHTFKDDSQRADYFVREYFALTHSRY